MTMAAAAIAIGNEMAMEILWRHNADPHVVDKAGNTLLLLACAGPIIVILKHILEYCSEVTMCNVAGETALHLASAAKNSSIIFESFSSLLSLIFFLSLSSLELIFLYTYRCSYLLLSIVVFPSVPLSYYNVFFLSLSRHLFHILFFFTT
jgi:ankyrin repeat protein